MTVKKPALNGMWALETCGCKKNVTLPEDPYFIYLYYAGPSYNRKQI